MCVYIYMYVYRSYKKEQELSKLKQTLLEKSLASFMAVTVKPVIDEMVRQNRRDRYKLLAS